MEDIQHEKPATPLKETSFTLAQLREFAEKGQENNLFHKRSNNKDKQSESLVKKYPERWWVTNDNGQFDIHIATAGEEKRLKIGDFDHKVMARIWHTFDDENGNKKALCYQLVEGPGNKQHWVLQENKEDSNYRSEEHTRYWNLGNETNSVMDNQVIALKSQMLLQKQK